MRGKPKARTIDGYLAGLSDDKRAAIEKLRKTIQTRSQRNSPSFGPLENGRLLERQNTHL